MVLMMRQSDKLPHNNALANPVTSFINSGGSVMSAVMGDRIECDYHLYWFIGQY